MTNRAARAVLAGLLVALTLAVYWPAAGQDFVPFDDPVYVTGNRHVLGGLGADGLRWSLTATDGGAWHPLTWWSHQLDVQLFGRRAGGHHATSVAVHAASGALLFAALTGMTGAALPSFAVAVLFALHPLHVESVAWVSERKDVLAALFWMISLLAYARYARRPSRARYALVLALFVLALTSKPMAVTLPLALLLLDFWPLGRLRGTGPAPAARLIAEKAPLLLLAAVVAAVTLQAQRAVGALEPLAAVPAPYRGSMLAMRAMNALASYWVYLRQAAWPADLAVFYPHPAHGLEPWRAAVAAAGLGLVTAAAFAVRRRAPAVAVGWLWYLVTLVPVIGLVQVGSQAHADRYTYLPLVGVFVAAAWSARDAARRRLPAPLGAALCAAALVALVALAAASARQLGHWRDGAALFRHALAVAPDDYVALRALGEAARREGDFAAAEDFFRRELQLSPRSSGAHNRLGTALSGLGRFDEAGAAFAEAVRIDPGNFEAQNNLGLLLTARGRLADAEAHLRVALRLRPGVAEIHANLGDNLARQGRIEEARQSLRAALALDPRLAAARARLEGLEARP